MDPAIHRQDTGSPAAATAPDAGARALALLADTRARQAGLPRPAAQAWERAAFCLVFDDPGPARRIRRFLDKA